MTRLAAAVCSCRMIDRGLRSTFVPHSSAWIFSRCSMLISLVEALVVPRRMGIAARLRSKSRANTLYKLTLLMPNARRASSQLIPMRGIWLCSIHKIHAARHAFLVQRSLSNGLAVSVRGKTKCLDLACEAPRIAAMIKRRFPRSNTYIVIQSQQQSVRNPHL